MKLFVAAVAALISLTGISSLCLAAGVSAHVYKQHASRGESTLLDASSPQGQAITLQTAVKFYAGSAPMSGYPTSDYAFQAADGDTVRCSYQGSILGCVAVDSNGKPLVYTFKSFLLNRAL